MTRREVKIIDTAYKWVNTPASGEYTLSMTSLAAGAAIIGARANLSNYGWSPEWVASFKCQFTSAPTVGQYVNIFLAYSADASGTASGGYSNAAAAITGADLVDKQFQFIQVASLFVDNVATEHRIFIPISPLMPFVQPVIYNATGVAFSATASHHEFLIIPTPRIFI